MSEKYLKPYQYYSDQYDKYTVERCRRIEKSDSEIKLPPFKGKEIPDEKGPNLILAFTNVHLYFVKGERYLQKDKTIQDWMKRDEDHDRFFEAAKEPEDITCLVCGRLMFSHLKTLKLGFEKEPDRVEFFFQCPLKHTPIRMFYDNGEEYKPEAELCPKCNSEFDIKHKKFKTKIVTTSTCLRCGHIKTYELDLRPKKEMVDPDLPKDRDRFCLSDKEGREYEDFKRRTDEMAEIMKKHKDKENNKDLYDKVAKLKKLKIVELEQLITPVLEKAQYIKFHFKDPEITKDVTVSFIAHDAKPNRTDRESVLTLSRLIRKSLEATNWRLMSEGVNYRLGMLGGRLRAYEKEEDLVKLVSL